MNRRNRIIILLGFAVLLVLIIFWFAINESISLSPLIIGDTVILFSILVFILILFLITFLILGRNIVKLILERKKKIIGAHFKSKLVMFFVGFSIIPAILLFLFAAGIISKSIEQWYKGPVKSVMKGAENIKTAIFDEYRETTLHFSNRILTTIVQRNLFKPELRQELNRLLIQKMKEYGLDLISLYINNKEEITILNPEIPLYEYKNIPDNLILKGIINGEIFRSDKLGTGEILRGGKSITYNGISILVVSGKYLYEKRFAPLRKIIYSLRRYKQLEHLKNPIKITYISIFLLITLLIIFSASWLGIHLAKEITIPVEKLVSATEEISKGKLNVYIDYESSDEFGFLIESFNKMVREINNTREIAEKQKAEMKKGKEFQESILHNIRAGIIVLDDQENVLELNSTAKDLLKIGETKSTKGKNIFSLIKDEAFIEIFEKILRVKRMGLRYNEFQTTVSSERGLKREIAIKITYLKEIDKGAGELIVVLDDLTDIIRAKRLSDWKMIAEKVAHELKNPLTPVQLSAQRIIKNIEKDDKSFKKIAKESAVSILSEVSGIKNLLDNFMAFARMPDPKFKPTNLNSLIEETVSVFREVNNKIEVEMELSPNLPDILLDPQQIKRVIVNLLNNASEAMNGTGKIKITTRLEGEKIIVEFSDTGPGIPKEIQDSIFTPYFSTKEKGTGLGLSIIQQIINEHKGELYLDKTYKKGAKFVVEFNK